MTRYLYFAVINF